MATNESATRSRAQLLIVALQDLWQARAVVRERMADIESATTDPETRAVLRDIRTAAPAEQDILCDLVSDPGDTPNLWAAGILDDASRDVETTASGGVRDIALIGAIRKLLAADIVSIETALQLGIPPGTAGRYRLAKLQSAACDRDRYLQARLEALTRQGT
jgi:hypothetical protein